jgi:hypothetical protein
MKDMVFVFCQFLNETYNFYLLSNAVPLELLFIGIFGGTYLGGLKRKGYK